MTSKQEMFANEYIKDLNATQAAIRAGYSYLAAGEIAWELLQKPEVAALIEKLMAERAARTRVQQDMVLNEVAHLAFSRVNHYKVDPDSGEVALTELAPQGAIAAVQSVKHRHRVRIDKDGAVVIHYECEIKLWDKPRMLALLGKHVGLFADRVEHVIPSEPITRIERVFLPALPPGSLALKGDTQVETACPVGEDTPGGKV